MDQLVATANCALVCADVGGRDNGRPADASDRRPSGWRGSGGCCAGRCSLSQVAMRVIAIAGLVFGVAPDASLNRPRGSHWHCKALTSIAEEEAAKLDNPSDFAGLSDDS
jgi:hypothetical protein